MQIPEIVNSNKKADHLLDITAKFDNKIEKLNIKLVEMEHKKVNLDEYSIEIKKLSEKGE